MLPDFLLVKEKPGIFFFFFMESSNFQIFQFRILKTPSQVRQNTCGLGAAACNPCLLALPVPLHRFHQTRQALCRVPSASQAAGWA